MAHWLQRYCTVDEGGEYDTPSWLTWSASSSWRVATNRKTVVAIRAHWSTVPDQDVAANGRMRVAVLTRTPTDAVECDLADLLRFAGYVQRDACASCCQGSKEMLYHWTITRPPYMQIGLCVDCWKSNGWITPAMPADDRKARVAGVTVCMSRLAWSIPPEVIEPDSRVLLWRHTWGVSDWPPALVIDDAKGNWRVMIAECKITDPAVTPPTYYPDPVFARLWEAARDCPGAMAALADWLEDRGDRFAEVLR